MQDTTAAGRGNALKTAESERKSGPPMDEVPIWSCPDYPDCFSMRLESLDRVQNTGIITGLLGWSNQL
jgi:hypothetical protein